MANPLGRVSSKEDADLPYVQVHSDPDVFCIRVPLPGNALKTVNSYVVRDGNDILVIDTGFNAPESYDALVGGFAELGFKASDANLFITHSHPDHYSLAEKLGCAGVFLHADTYDEIKYVIDGTCDWVQADTTIEMGFNPEEVETIARTSPLGAQACRTLFEATTLDEDDMLQVGRFSFKPIYTPGHCPGHLCLYLPERELLFTGDHILFDISPNISHWAWSVDTLAEYKRSLAKMRDLPVSLALPGHRKPRNEIALRVDELLRHHESRLEECLGAIGLVEGQTACDIAQHISWAHSSSFLDMGLTQRLFAASETRAHVEHLVALGLVKRERIDGIVRYSA